MNLRTALNANDTAVDELTRLTTELEQSQYKLSEMLYSQATAQCQRGQRSQRSEYPEAEPQAEPHDDTVIETEFK